MMNNTAQHTDKPVKQVIAEITQKIKEFWVFCVEHPVIATLLILLALSFSILGLVIYIHHFEKIDFWTWWHTTTALEKLFDTLIRISVFAFAIWFAYVIIKQPKWLKWAYYPPFFPHFSEKTEQAIIQAPVKAFDYICSLFKGNKH